MTLISSYWKRAQLVVSDPKDQVGQPKVDGQAGGVDNCCDQGRADDGEIDVETLGKDGDDGGDEVGPDDDHSQGQGHDEGDTGSRLPGEGTQETAGS